MKVFPKGKENMALALWAMVLLVGPISGPIVGGGLQRPIHGDGSS